MSTTIEVPETRVAARDITSARTSEQIWPLYAVLFSSMSIVVGLIWNLRTEVRTQVRSGLSLPATFQKR